MAILCSSDARLADRNLRYIYKMVVSHDKLQGPHLQLRALPTFYTHLVGTLESKQQVWLGIP